MPLTDCAVRFSARRASSPAPKVLRAIRTGIFRDPYTWYLLCIWTANLEYRGPNVRFGAVVDGPIRRVKVAWPPVRSRLRTCQSATRPKSVVKGRSRCSHKLPPFEALHRRDSQLLASWARGLAERASAIERFDGVGALRDHLSTAGLGASVVSYRLRAFQHLPVSRSALHPSGEFPERHVSVTTQSHPACCSVRLRVLGKARCYPSDRGWP